MVNDYVQAPGRKYRIVRSLGLKLPIIEVKLTRLQTGRVHKLLTVQYTLPGLGYKLINFFCCKQHLRVPIGSWSY